MKKDETIAQVEDATERRGFWRTSFLLITSAACGGIAVAIWNRRTLALMRAQSDASSNALIPAASDGQEKGQ